MFHNYQKKTHFLTNFGWRFQFVCLNRMGKAIEETHGRQVQSTLTLKQLRLLSSKDAEQTVQYWLGNHPPISNVSQGNVNLGQNKNNVKQPIYIYMYAHKCAKSIYINVSSNMQIYKYDVHIPSPSISCQCTVAPCSPSQMSDMIEIFPLFACTCLLDSFGVTPRSSKGRINKSIVAWPSVTFSATTNKREGLSHSLEA